MILYCYNLCIVSWSLHMMEMIMSYKLLFTVLIFSSVKFMGCYCNADCPQHLEPSLGDHLLQASEAYRRRELSSRRAITKRPLMTLPHPHHQMQKNWMMLTSKRALWYVMLCFLPAPRPAPKLKPSAQWRMSTQSCSDLRSGAGHCGLCVVGLFAVLGSRV